MWRALILVALLAICGNAAGQEATQKIPVYVEAQCSSDPVGETLVYETKDAINRSSLMTLAASYTASVVQLKIVCLTPSRDDTGSVTKYAYSVTALNTSGYYDYQLTFGVGDCGSKRVGECAQGLTADVYSSISDLRNKIKNGKFKFSEQ